MCLGSLDCFYDPLPKFSVYKGNAELLLKSMAKVYSVKDLNATEATKSMIKVAFGNDQRELLPMVKKDVHQGEVIIDKLDQVIAGIERL